MADNLESYFKKHLSDDSPGEGDWNVPSDDVWNKALPEIQKKRGLFIPWKYLYILGALIAVGLVVIFWPFDSSMVVDNSNDLASSNMITDSNSSSVPLGSLVLDDAEAGCSITAAIRMIITEYLIVSSFSLPDVLVYSYDVEIIT